MPNNLSGQIDLFASTEGLVLPGNTDVASFTDGNTNDTSFNFTATIDWGDGNTTTGTVVGTNGSFTVLGGHTYLDEGFPNAVVTVTRNTDNAQLVLQGGVFVSDADLLNVNPGPNITGSPGTSTGNVVVATFSDNFANSASDFTAPIDWGDGTTTMGTVTGSGGQYTITGSHTYTTNGAFTVTTFATDDGPDAASNGTQIQAIIGLGGNLAPAITSGSEPFPIGAGTTVATFSDSVLDPASDYTATIDWGDGTTEIGTVTGSPGSFAVSSTVGHTYADEGDFTANITINRAVDGANPAATTTITGTVVVADTDNLSSGSTTVTGSPGVALTNVTVATVSGENDPTDLTATIDWGDGTTTAGTVSGGNVLGSHTYGQNGQFAIAVTVNDDANAQAIAFTDVQSTALIGLAPVAGDQITIAEGNAVAGGQEVATFTDNVLTDTPANFTATIDWGDGTTSAGTVTGGSGSFTVTSGSGHSYTGAFGDEGQDTVKTTLTRTDNTTATAFGAVNITESDAFSLTADSISGNAGQAFTNVQVATFTDTYTGHADGSGFTALVNWGDGTTTLGTISGSGGSFTVDGSHTYTAGGNDTLTVSLVDNAPGTASASATASANINLGGQVTLTSATEGTALPGTTPVATFSDNVLTDTASNFTATVDWGDGVTTAGTVVGAAGSFTVEGGHTYADEGNDTATVTLTRTSDSSTAAVSGVVAVGEGDSFTGHGTTLSVAAFQPFSGTVATFTDSDTGNVASDLTSTIDWGDGTTTPGTISGGSGSFTVNGSHIYTGQGTDTVTVSILDDNPSTQTGTATSTANIAALSGQMVFNSATEATAVPNNTPIAKFVDSNGTDTASSFTASIDWGDGVTTAGTVVGSTGSFTVEGGHTYADEGNDPARVVLTRTSDNASATASGTVAVAEGDVLTGHGTTFRPKANQPFTGVVATFSDTDTANTSGDFTATINWGDGTTTAGTVSGGSGTLSVSGTHTYAHSGHENVTVTLSDDAPGTATATANSSANVSTLARNDFNGDNKSDFLLQNNGSNNPNVMVEVLNGTSIASSGTITTPKGWTVDASADFNNDGKSDIVVQNSDGTPQIWLMNGATRTSTVTLSNPGSAWHVIAASDFNNDGTSDLLFQNASTGAVQIWEMNGTSVVSTATVGNPGISWHVIGAGDFNNDGNADILFQNDDSTPMIWEMNGSSIVAQASLPNPGKFWHAIGTGDFNGDGMSDVLYQNKDGQPLIWEMNGTSILTQATLTNPGTQLHAIGTGDFNGDGKSDILYQNSDGTPVVWDMNGTSVVSTATYTNPGSSWVLKDDGPITSDGKGPPTLGPTLQLSPPAAPNANVSSAPGISNVNDLSLTVGQHPLFAGARGA